MDHVTFGQPFDMYIGLMPWSRFHEPMAGNGFSFYPAVLMAVFKGVNKEFVAGDIQDIPGADPQTSEVEAMAIAQEWLQGRRKAGMEAVSRWVTD